MKFTCRKNGLSVLRCINSSAPSAMYLSVSDVSPIPLFNSGLPCVFLNVQLRYPVMGRPLRPRTTSPFFHVPPPPVKSALVSWYPRVVGLPSFIHLPEYQVEYPPDDMAAGHKINFGFIFSPPMPRTPLRNPVQPVRISARLGTQSGLEQIKFSKVIPLCTSQSRLGVSMRGLPSAPIVSGR